jgi:hypothetical protein
MFVKPLLHAIWACATEMGGPLLPLPFVPTPPQRGFWRHYQDAVDSQRSEEAAELARIYEEELPNEPELPADEPDDQVQWDDYEPEREPVDIAPTRDELLADMTAQHEQNLAHIEQLPLDDDVREGLKNEAMDRFERKVREWLS